MPISPPTSYFPTAAAVPSPAPPLGAPRFLACRVFRLLARLSRSSVDGPLQFLAAAMNTRSLLLFHAIFSLCVTVNTLGCIWWNVAQEAGIEGTWATASECPGVVFLQREWAVGGGLQLSKRGREVKPRLATAIASLHRACWADWEQHPVWWGPWQRHHGALAVAWPAALCLLRCACGASSGLLGSRWVWLPFMQCAERHPISIPFPPRAVNKDFDLTTASDPQRWLVRYVFAEGAAPAGRAAMCWQPCARSSLWRCRCRENM
jgi:hypothetical protein